MHIAVIIPFRGNSKLLRWTLEGYACQRLTLGQSLEVHVGLDGDVATVPHSAPNTTIHRFPRIGAAGIRNLLSEKISADILIFGNADARPDPDMVRIHAETLTTQPLNTMVLGAAPWQKPPSPTVFDALLADTPMVFFYNQLTPHGWYDFRHAWTLNLSIRHADFLRAGGFEKRLRPVYYEDLAFGYRLLGLSEKGIFYEPAAKVLHDHPTTLEQYLDREELLGLMSPVLAATSPDAFNALHGNRSVRELADEFRTWVAMDLSSHRWILERLQEWAVLPESSLGDPGSPEAQRLKLTIYQMHIPLKRLAFRIGFLRGLELLDDSQWEQRQPSGLWKKALFGN